jgi:hypothetical protein
VPDRDVVAEVHLARIRSIGYSRLEQSSQRLRSECFAVDNVVYALTAHGAIIPVTSANTRCVVAAGGFERASTPSCGDSSLDRGSPCPH